ncbi:hypothetical protein BDF19DRAFT_487129 [Syncephalis fuscata]|nr:hypothetical protein BDF19DRAFT_487129 [Syncephalis fuscata]
MRGRYLRYLLRQYYNDMYRIVLPLTYYRFIIFLLLITLSIDTCQANLTLTYHSINNNNSNNSNSNSTLTVDTSDLFLKQPVSLVPPKHNGTLILLPIRRDRCAFATFNSSNTAIKEIARQASNYNDTGLLILWPLAKTVGCASIAQLVSAAQDVSPHIEKIGFPSITWMGILAQPISSTPVAGMYRAWGPDDEVDYGNLVKKATATAPTTNNSSGNNSTTKASITIALINEYDSKKIVDFSSKQDIFLFTAIYGKYSI